MLLYGVVALGKPQDKVWLGRHTLTILHAQSYPAEGGCSGDMRNACGTRFLLLTSACPPNGCAFGQRTFSLVYAALVSGAP
jgi:hypothetical protein